MKSSEALETTPRDPLVPHVVIVGFRRAGLTNQGVGRP
jgi:hypothetical protein